VLRRDTTCCEVPVHLGGSGAEGEPVEGRGIDLLMAACGRRAVPPRLRGPGAPTFTART